MPEISTFLPKGKWTSRESLSQICLSELGGTGHGEALVYTNLDLLPVSLEPLLQVGYIGTLPHFE